MVRRAFPDSSSERHSLLQGLYPALLMNVQTVDVEVVQGLIRRRIKDRAATNAPPSIESAAEAPLRELRALAT